MAQEYGSFITTTEPEYSISLSLKLEEFPQDPEERNALIKSLSLIRRNALSAPFERAFDLQKELEKTPPEPNEAVQPQIMAIHYRWVSCQSLSNDWL
jgi:actin related protein 2/3 complex subunit 2